MVIPAVRVELFTGEYSADFLTLDDPAKGELDEALYPLFDGSEPDASVDLVGDAYAYSTRRGRSSELDDVSVGTLAVSLRNFGGQLVPNSLVSSAILDEDGEPTLDEDGRVITSEWADYGYDLLVPGKRIRLHLDEVVVYDGRVNDIDLEYDISGDASAQITAVDALGVLAQAELDAWSTSAQTAGERIVAVLDRPEVDFPANRSVGSDGSTEITNDTVAAGTNALSYVKLVTYSDLGYTYASRLGLLTFEPRRSVTRDVQAEFSDDGAAIPFSGVKPSSSRRYLYNRISVTRLGGAEQVVNDAASQAKYGVQPLTLTDLLMNTDTDALNMAGSMLSFYSEPATRIESLTVNLGALTSSQRATVLSLELGDFVTVKWTPSGTTQTTQTLRVEGIDIGGTYSSLGAVQLSLSPATYFPTPFLVDDAEFGVLDTSLIFY